MRGRLAAVLTVVVASYAVPVLPQDAGLTSQDLKASYCFGYFSAQKQAQQQMCRAGGVFAGTPMCAPEARAQVSADQDAKLKRLETYLAARDILFSSNQAVFYGFVLANDQGMKDLQQCIGWAGMRIEMHTPTEQACLSACATKFYSKSSSADAAGDLMNCTRGCQPDVCRKAHSCENMDYLPW